MRNETSWYSHYRNLFLLDGQNLSHQTLYFISQLFVRGDYAMVLGLSSIKQKCLAITVDNVATCLLYHEGTGADVPLMHGSEGQRAVTLSTGDFRQPIRDAADGLDFTKIHENLKFA